MLILSRRAGEAIDIGEDVKVVVVGVRDGVVQIGVKAPRSITVHREEISQRIKAEHVAPAYEQPKESPRAELPREQEPVASSQPDAPNQTPEPSGLGSLLKRLREGLLA